MRRVMKPAEFRELGVLAICGLEKSQFADCLRFSAIARLLMIQSPIAYPSLSITTLQT
jgi:hypothetical protein